MPDVGIWRNDRHDYWAAYDAVKVGPLPSVTGILGSIAKPALVQWAAKQSATFAVENHLLIDQMLIAGGATDTIRYIATEATRTRDKAAGVGTAVHALAASLSGPARGVEGDAVTQPYIDGFMSWVTEVRPNIILTEQMGVNLDVGYGGTFDMIAEFKGHRWLIDLKTSRGVYPETAMQLAAYAKFEYLGKPDDPTKYPMPVCSRFAVLHLRPGVASFVEMKPTAHTWEAFKGAAKVHTWLKGEALNVMQGSTR